MPISTRVISHQKEKGGVLCCFVLPVVMCELGQREVCGPVRLLVISKESEVGLHPLIISFGLSVRPRVVRRGDVLLNSQRTAQFLDEFRHESWIPVAYDFVRESVSSHYHFEKRARGPFHRDSLVTGAHVAPMFVVLRRTQVHMYRVSRQSPRGPMVNI